MSTAAILTAAGSGSRLGATLPKALVLLAGVPLVAHAAHRLVESGAVELVVVTVPAGFVGAFEAALATAPGAATATVPVRYVVGGVSRQASVAAALAVLPPDVDVVLVHDAARALAPAALVARVVDAVRAGHRAVIPATALTDTIVEVGAADTRASDEVVAHPDRAVLRAVQTPQGFDRGLLDAAHRAAAHRADDEARAATDDASLVALLGEPVHVVPGDPDALKITTGRDLALAGLLLAGAR